MESTADIIRSCRLDLVLLESDALALSLARDAAALERRLGLAVPAAWYEAGDLIRLRLEQIGAEPAYRPWSLRAMALRETRQMVGFIGFHTPPGAPYLAPYAPGGVEFGYTVFPPFRRCGYATEASRALMQWAHVQHGITQFVLSISPANLPSLRLAARLGFVRVGSHIDDEDGPEEILRLDYAGPARPAPPGA